MFKEIMANNFPKLTENIKLWIQNALQTTNKINIKKNTLSTKIIAFETIIH